MAHLEHPIKGLKLRRSIFARSASTGFTIILA